MTLIGLLLGTCRRPSPRWPSVSAVRAPCSRPGRRSFSWWWRASPSCCRCWRSWRPGNGCPACGVRECFTRAQAASWWVSWAGSWRLKRVRRNACRSKGFARPAGADAGGVGVVPVVDLLGGRVRSAYRATGRLGRWSVWRLVQCSTWWVRWVVSPLAVHQFLGSVPSGIRKVQCRPGIVLGPVSSPSGVGMMVICPSWTAVWWNWRRRSGCPGRSVRHQPSAR